MRKALVVMVLAVLILVGGCSTLTNLFCSVTPTQLDQAVVGLAKLDTFYGKLVALKVVPDYTVFATMALQLADAAAITYKDLRAGICKDQDAINQAAAKVEAAKMMAGKI